MSTLLLRLAAPMQAWGVDGKFDKRPTEFEPTRSGIIGMIACAMGIKREESLDIFENMKIGVRVDQQGEKYKDFHMVHKYNEKTKKVDSSWLTSRYYLFDAVFLVGIEAEDFFLEKIKEALESPVFPIYLGRRSCPPTGKIALGIRRDKNLKEALEEEPWLAADWYKKRSTKEVVSLRVVKDIESGEKEAYTVRDIPISFSQRHRKYDFRSVAVTWVKITSEKVDEVLVDQIQTNHNPMDI